MSDPSNPSDLLKEILDALRQARIDQADAYDRLKACQAPWREQMDRVGQVEARAFAEARKAEEELSRMAREEYEQALTERQSALDGGATVGAITMPPGCEVRMVQHAVVTDEAHLPPECYRVHLPAVLARLRKGSCPGAVLAEVPQFSFAATAEKG